MSEVPDATVQGRTARPRRRTQALFTPMHSDNWALSLGSGFLGHGLSRDAARDLSSSIGAIAGTLGSLPPKWAVDEGDAGPRVVLEIDLRADQLTGLGPLMVSARPIRVTQVRQAIFATEGDLENFRASYRPFPDIPIGLIPAVVGTQFADGAPRPSDFQPAASWPFAEEAMLADAFAGWAVGLIQLLRLGTFDNEIKSMISAPPPVNGLSTVAAAALSALHPTATTFDVGVWRTVVEAAAEKRAEQGFDRLQLLESISNRLNADGHDPERVRKWVGTAGRVFRAEADPPPLTDSGSIGQRAALTFLLAPDTAAAASVREVFNAGPRVTALVSLAASAFTGFTRLPADAKEPREALDGILDLSDALRLGTPSKISFSARRTDEHLRETDEVFVNGKLVLTRRFEASAYKLILRARAQEAGLELKADGALGALYVEGKATEGLKVFVQEDEQSSSEHPVVRLIAPVAEAKRWGSNIAKLCMEVSWNAGCALGVRRVGKNEQLCAFTIQPTDTLDRDEFAFHLTRLAQASKALTSAIESLRREPSKATNSGEETQSRSLGI